MSECSIMPIDDVLVRATTEVLGLVDVCQKHFETRGVTADADALVALTEAVLLRAGMITAAE